LRRLRRETRSRPLGVALLLERGLLRRGRRRGRGRGVLEPRWCRACHVRRLLLLLWWRRRGSKASLGTLPGHYCAEHVASHTNRRGWLLGRTGMLRRLIHGARRTSTVILGNLTTKHRNLLFVSIQ